eukprot:jgi/Bigna1/137384/aug1.39_g12092
MGRSLAYALSSSSRKLNTDDIKLSAIHSDNKEDNSFTKSENVEDDRTTLDDTLSMLENPSQLPWKESIATTTNGTSIKMLYMPFLETMFQIFAQEGFEVESLPTTAEFLSRNSSQKYEDREEEEEEEEEEKAGAAGDDRDDATHGPRKPIHQGNVKADARVGSVCFRTKGSEFRRVRLEYLDAGPRAQILNALFYPDYSLELPMLGIDLLSFNSGKRILIGIDYHPLTQDDDYISKYIEPLQMIKNDFPELQGEISQKIYDSFEFFSPAILFGRYLRMASSFSKLPRRSRGGFNRGRNITGQTREWIAQRQHAYNRYNFENDPAAGIFASNFGKEWSDRFMSEFLFEIPSHNISMI